MSETVITQKSGGKIAKDCEASSHLRLASSVLLMVSKPRPKKIFIAQKLAADIGTQILSGQLKTGARLATEVSASGSRLISRAGYREAIRTLVAKGLIETYPKIGSRVTRLEFWHLLDPDVLTWMFSQGPEPEIIGALFELRSILEPEAAAFAAKRRTLAQLNEMGYHLEVMARATLDSEEGRRADEAFHAKLIEASRNPFLVSLGSSIIAAIGASTTFKYRLNRKQRDPMPEHLRVFEAVAAQDEAASAQAMRNLINLALSDVTRIVGRGKKGRVKSKDAPRR